MTEMHAANDEARTTGLPQTACLRASLRKRLVSRKHEFSLEADFELPTAFTILFGASGAGKTTLLDCLAAITTPDSGIITIGPRILFDSSRNINVPGWNRRCGYVFQTLALFPHMTAEENILYGLSRAPREERTRRAAAILDLFRIASLARRKVRDLSGGESQRVALARTLVTDPDFLLLDEPLAALDRPTKGLILDDLREWNRVRKIPILSVTHSREEVFALGEHVIVLEKGKIIAQGTPHEVLSAPQMETVAQLAGFENIFDTVVEAVRPDRGTMTCRIPGEAGGFLLETPLVRGGVGANLRVGIRAGDILLATSPPTGLSARNVFPGRIRLLEQRDVIVSARVNCRVEMEVHLTLAARDSLELSPGKEVWLVIKTHSCHLMQR